MEFNVKKWRKYYDKIKLLGQKVKDSYPTIDDDKVCHYPLHPLSFDEREEINKEIKRLKDESSKYLDQCGLKMTWPLWRYSIKDCTTWISHPSFRFKHLID